MAIVDRRSQVAKERCTFAMQRDCAVLNLAERAATFINKVWKEFSAKGLREKMHGVCGEGEKTDRE